MHSVPAARPPVAETVGSWTLASVTELSGMRANLVRSLDAHASQGGEQLAETHRWLVLVASELATNALVHAGSPAHVTLRGTPDRYVLEVVDHAPGSRPAIARDRAPGAGGFGLVLTQKLASTVGWFVDGSRKHVWATFSAPGRAGGSASAPDRRSAARTSRGRRLAV